MKPGIVFYKPNLPDAEVYQGYLDHVWESKVLTNNGPLVRELETRLSGYLGIRHVVAVANGTMALQLAIRALGWSDKPVATTPFSFVASTSSLVWEHSRPVFTDIDPESLCMTLPDPSVQHEGLLPVQIFGLPFGASLAQSGKPVLVDGAQSFGVFRNGRSILSDGLASIVSFHATKYFHTVEGGAILTNDDDLAAALRPIRDFGWNEAHTSISGLGINGKLSEVHAAMGLALFDRVDAIRQRQRQLYHYYLESILGKEDRMRIPLVPGGLDYHYAYFPLIFTDAVRSETFIDRLQQAGIGYKRYFEFPLNRMPYVRGNACPVAESICSRIVSVPLYAGLTDAEAECVAGVLRGFQS